MARAKREVRYVTPHPDGWANKLEGAKRPSGVFPTKAQAVKQAVQQAHATAASGRPAQVKIQKQNGRLQEERTYGNDPYPPKG